MGDHRVKFFARLGLAAAAVAVVTALLVPSAFADAPAKDANTFVNSIGVDVHLGYSDTVYNNFPAVREKLDDLGIHYVRDGFGLGTSELYARYRTLFGDGIKLDAIVGDPQQRYGSGTVSQQLDMLESELGSGLASLEGPNEYDQSGDPNWATTLRNYQQEVWEGAKSRPQLANLPILGPSLVRGESREELGDLTAWTTEGNMHPYSGGQIPDSNSHMESELNLAAKVSLDQPVQATEAGYNNALNATTGQPGISENAAAIYTPRMYLDDFRRGITRTYAYELLDDHPDPGHVETEYDFGLLRNDFSEKPAYTALQHLIAVLSDPGPGFSAGRLDYSLSGAPSDVRQLLLQKRDGSFYLALWNPVSVWNTQNGTESVPADTSATLDFGQAVSSAAVYRPDQSAAPTRTVSSPASMSVPIGPSVTIVEVTPGDGEPVEGTPIEEPPPSQPESPAEEPAPPVEVPVPPVEIPPIEEALPPVKEVPVEIPPVTKPGGSTSAVGGSAETTPSGPALTPEAAAPAAGLTGVPTETASAPPVRFMVQRWGAWRIVGQTRNSRHGWIGISAKKPVSSPARLRDWVVRFVPSFGSALW